MIFNRLSALAAMAVIVAGFIAADLWLLHAAYVNPEYVTQEVGRLLGRPVQLGRISAGPAGVVAENFRVPCARGDLLRAERIRIHLDRAKLVDGEIAIREIELEGPMVRFEMDEDGRCELLNLVADVANRLKGEESKTGMIPTIRIRDGILAFRHALVVAGEKPLEVQDVDAVIMPYGPSAFRIEGTASAGVLGAWGIDGTIDTTTGRVELRFSTKGFEISPETVARFSEPVRKAYENYGVAGPVDVVARIVHDPRETRSLQLSADILARGLTVRYANFPYRVVGVTGNIQLSEAGIQFQNMLARMWPTKDGETATPVAGQEAVEIAMSGWTDGYESDAAYKLHFDIRRLPVDDKLRGAMQPSARDVYDLFKPSGAVSGQVDVKREHGVGMQINHKLDMQLENCAATFKPFPYLVERATGRIQLDWDILTISDVRCFHGDAEFRVDGVINSLEPEGTIDVTVEARGVPVEEDARRALPPVVGDIWKRLSPAGKIDLLWKTKKGAGKDAPLEYDVTITPRGLSAMYDGVPYRVDGISRGTVWTDAKTVKIDGVRGKHGSAAIEVSGTLTDLDKEPSYELTISAQELPIDGDLKAALPADFKATLDDLGLKGLIELKDFRFRHSGAEPEKLKFEAQEVTLFDASFDAGMEFTKAVLAFKGVSGTIGEDGVVFGGALAPSNARIEGLKLTDIIAHIQYGDGQLSIEDLKASSYGGRIEASVYYKIEDKGFKLVMKTDEIDLLQLTRDTAFAGNNIRGKLGGKVELHGEGSKEETYYGHGELAVRDAELVEVPILAGIFTSLNVKGNDVFHRGTVEFDIEEKTRRLKVDYLKFESDSLTLVTRSGYMDFDGKLNLMLKPKFGSRGILFPLELIDKFLEGTTAFHVTGTFRKPDIAVKAVLDITKWIPGADKDDSDKK